MPSGPLSCKYLGALCTSLLSSLRWPKVGRWPYCTVKEQELSGKHRWQGVQVIPQRKKRILKHWLQGASIERASGWHALANYLTTLELKPITAKSLVIVFPDLLTGLLLGKQVVPTQLGSIFVQIREVRLSSAVHLLVSNRIATTLTISTRNHPHQHCINDNLNFHLQHDISVFTNTKH